MRVLHKCRLHIARANNLISLVDPTLSTHHKESVIGMCVCCALTILNQMISYQDSGIRRFRIVDLVVIGQNKDADPDVLTFLLVVIIYTVLLVVTYNKIASGQLLTQPRLVNLCSR